MSGLMGLIFLLSAPTFQSWQKTVREFCHQARLPAFSPIRSLPLSRLSDFSPSAIAWELKSPDGKTAWAITDPSGQHLLELGFSKPFWQRKELKERLLIRFGSFLSDGSWHFLYRGLSGYGLAVKKLFEIPKVNGGHSVWVERFTVGVLKPIDEVGEVGAVTFQRRRTFVLTLKGRQKPLSPVHTPPLLLRW